MSPPPFPVEILRAICLSGLSTRSLSRFCLVSRVGLDIARPLLYRKICITSLYFNYIPETLTLLANNQKLALCVQNLSITVFMSDHKVPALLHPILTHALSNMRQLQSIRIHGHIFQNTQQQELFFSTIVAHCPLVERLNFIDLSSDFSTPSLANLRVKYFWATSGSKYLCPLPVLQSIYSTSHQILIDYMIRPIIEASRLTLRQIALPIWFTGSNGHWLWSIQFPRLKSIIIASSKSGDNVIIPPRPTIQPFFLNNVQSLEWIQFTNFPGCTLDSKNQYSYCRLSYALDPTHPDMPITIRTMRCRLEIFEYYTDCLPTSFENSLESLTLQYSFRPECESLLKRLLKAFKTHLYIPQHNLSRLRSFHLKAYFRPDNPQSDSHIFNPHDMTLQFLDVLSRLCANTLTVLHGAVFPVPIHAVCLAQTLSKFTKLKSFSLFADTIHSNVYQVHHDYVSTLAKSCPSLTEIHICKPMLDTRNLIDEPIRLMNFELENAQIISVQSN
jgi:hypothetical protein